MSVKIKSFIQLIISLIIMGLGINLVTHANLGTTATTSPAFVISQFTPLTFGTLNTLFNLLYIIIQILLLKEDFPKIQYFQIFLGVTLGLSIDGWGIVLTNFSPDNYVIRLGLVILGSFVIAFSTVIQLKADFVNNPVVGIVKAIAIKTKQPFGKVKSAFDIFLVILAVLISFIAMGTLEGIREATLISGIMVGYFVSFIQKFDG